LEKKSNVFSKNFHFLLILFFIVQGIGFSVMFPLWEGIDEPANFGYVQHLVETQEIPIFNVTKLSDEITLTYDKIPLTTTYAKAMGYRGGDAESYTSYWRNTSVDQIKENEEFIVNISKEKRIPTEEFDRTKGDFKLYEAQLPPVSYLAQTPVYALLYENNILDRVLALRIFSVLLTAIAIFVAYKTISLIFQDEFMRIGSLMFLVFNPMFTVNVSRVNNEAVTILLFSVFLYLMVLYLKEKPNLKLVLAISAVLILGLLSKPTFISAAGIIPLVILFKQIQNNSHSKIDLKNNLRNFGIIIGIVIPSVSWWYLEKFLEGNFSGVQAPKLATITIEQFFLGVFNMDYVILAERYLVNFWGRFAWDVFPPDELYFQMVKIFIFISIVGLSWYIWKAVKMNRLRVFKDFKIQILIVFMVPFLIIFIGQLYVNFQLTLMIRPFQANAWYLFIAMTAIATFLILGYRGLINNTRLRRIKNELLIVELMILIVLNSSVFFHLLPKYYVGEV